MIKVLNWMLLRSIILSAVLFSTYAQAVAIVESRGEPLYDPEFHQATQHSNSHASSHASVSTPAIKTREDRSLQTLNQIEALKQEISELRGLVEVQDHEIKQLKKSQQDFYLDLEKRISEKQSSKNMVTTPVNENTNIKVGKTKGIQIIPKGKETPKETPKEASKASVKEVSTESRKETKIETSNAISINEANNKKSNKEVVKIIPSVPNSSGVSKNTTAQEQTNSEKEIYDMAYNLVTSKQYDTAIIALEDFLVQYPRGEYSANANYWLGEIHMVKWQQDKNNMGILDDAARYFTSVEKDFPATAKVSDSLLKLGLIAIEKGDISAARRYFTDVKIKYPKTAAARVAEVKLQQTSQN